MLPPTVKQFFFKLLISIFVHDYKNVLRQYRQAYTTQRQMKQYLRVITPEDLYDKELVRISERMSDLQKLIYQLRKKGLSDEAISRKLNLPLHKIQKHLNLVELDILQISRYFILFATIHYQIITRSSGAMYMASPSLISKALKKVSILRNAALTRQRPNE